MTGAYIHREVLDRFDRLRPGARWPFKARLMASLRRSFTKAKAKPEPERGRTDIDKSRFLIEQSPIAASELESREPRAAIISTAGAHHASAEPVGRPPAA